MNALQLINQFKRATFGDKIATWELRRRYDVFHVEDLYDDGQHVGYKIVAPGTLHQNSGFQKLVRPIDFGIRMPSQQFIVDDVAHWPFEALSIQLAAEPAYHELADQLAKKAFSASDQKVLKHIRYGVMPGSIDYSHGDPIFTIDPENIDTLLFYANQSMKGFAGFRGFNCVSVGVISIILMPVSLAAELIA